MHRLCEAIKSDDLLLILNGHELHLMVPFAQERCHRTVSHVAHSVVLCAWLCIRIVRSKSECLTLNNVYEKNKIKRTLFNIYMVIDQMDSNTILYA